MKSMPTPSGSSSRRDRWRRKRPCRLASISELATPETRNSRARRQGEDSRISGSSAALADVVDVENGLFTCQSQLT